MDGIVFRSNRPSRSAFNLYWQRSDGAGDAQRLTEGSHNQQPGSWHPSGKYLAFSEESVETNPDLWILPIDGNESSGWKIGKPTVFLKTPFIEQEPMFSPDGRWLAYFSNESGPYEVYVRPFPGPGGKWQISTGGGVYPTWSRARSELFFFTLDQQIMVASYKVDGQSFGPINRGLGRKRGSSYVRDIGLSTSTLTATASPCPLCRKHKCPSSGTKLGLRLQFFRRAPTTRASQGAKQLATVDIS